jgi:riboflavin kinase/FMN adenylyltransferase
MGSQPTFGINDFQVEAHLLDFDGNLYGKNIEVSFAEKIRDEKAFTGLEELANQIRKDEIVARRILSVMNS